MAKTIIVAGYGIGISKAVAEKFASEGFAVALVARNADKLAQGVKELEQKGAKALAIPGDLGNESAVAEIVAKARALGPIHVVQWTAFGSQAGNVLEADAAAFHAVLDVATIGLTAAVRAALPDLKETKGSVLVTNGGLGFFDPNVDKTAVQWNAMGVAIANSAKHKLVGLLAEKLRGDGVYVGEVMVLGAVKGTAFDPGNATIEAKTIAEKFWELHTSRKDTTVNVG
jgi:NADP-dependent 3-hydroxy acid dehydrogenase YdfG